MENLGTTGTTEDSIDHGWSTASMLQLNNFQQSHEKNVLNIFLLSQHFLIKMKILIYPSLNPYTHYWIINTPPSGLILGRGVYEYTPHTERKLTLPRITLEVVI